MDPNRQAAARAVLTTTHAQETFDQLCQMYPHAALFWDSEDNSVELGLFPIPSNHEGGLTTCEVTIRVA